MGMLRKEVCPSPRQSDETQQFHQRRSDVPESAKSSIEVLTMNINSWKPFRDKWTTEGMPQGLQTAQVICIQEHKLQSDTDCDDATEWCAARGFHAVFKPSGMSASGRASGGVAILVAQRGDVGITEPAVQLLEDETPRIMALQLAMPGLDPTIIVSAYFEAAIGLSELNRRLLAKLAIWQQEFNLQVLAGGDFNINAEQLRSSRECWERSRLQMIATSEPTYTTADAASTIDYFVVSSTLVDQVTTREVLTLVDRVPPEDGGRGGRVLRPLAIGAASQSGGAGTGTGPVLPGLRRGVRGPALPQARRPQAAAL